jgi:mannose-1-phosphate guanylyltransferase
MMALHSKHRGVGTILGVNVPRATATQYGCIVKDPENEGQVLHYVEKPESWISDIVNGGVYRESHLTMRAAGGKGEERGCECQK